MIIWRGWGFLSLLFGLAAGLIGGAIGGRSVTRMVPIGLCFVAFGVGLWFFGVWLNQQRPLPRFDAWFEHRKAEIASLVQVGHFNAPHPQAPTGQPHDPWAAADRVLQSEAQQVRARLLNQHTMFWIPMQYLGILMGVGGIATVISGILAR